MAIMEEHSLFDYLVRELDSEERRALLVRMQGALPSYPVELAPAGDVDDFVPEAEAGRLGLFRRLVLLLTALLTGKDRSHLLRELYLRRLGEQIRRRNPGLIDFRNERFLDGMREELSRLADSARLFRGLLSGALSGGPGSGHAEGLSDDRRAFIAFLARDELRSFQTAFARDTDPQQIWRSLPLAEERTPTLERTAAEERRVREEMLARFTRLVASIPEESKRRLYRDTAALYGLHSLAAFDFESLRAPFERHRLAGGFSCPFAQLAPALRELAENLSVVNHPPSPQALYDLILFSHREQLDEANPDLEERLRERLAGAREALEAISRFHERVPLVAILRFVRGDPYYLPRVSGGGEDWFLLYQDFWRRRLQRSYQEFVQARVRKQLEERCRWLLGGRLPPQLDNYRDDKFGADTPVLHALSLAFLAQFHATAFLELHRPLKLIYLNGEFFREDNRRAFTDAFHFFDSLTGTIGALEARLGPSGDLRAAIQSIKNTEPRKRLQTAGIRDVLSRADVDARALVEQGEVELAALADLLGGILEGRPGEPFDSLANLRRLGGRENPELTRAWKRAMELCGQAHRLLREILALELA
ncbi:MAG: hypothetical protein JW820_17945 [Spirochaetales bacterium]|nr:hypothetical protein [Spirochaetales bacterium]